MTKKDKDQREVSLKLNPEIYPLDIVFKAAYIMIDSAYVIIDGDPKKELIIHLRSKGSTGIEDIKERFNDELINISVYEIQSKKNGVLREEYLKRALLTNINDEADDYIEDKEGIFVPWEEKYG